MAPSPAPQPIATLTLKQWRENPGFQQKLRLLLDDPIFQHAHASLMAIAFPCVEPSSKADVGIGAEAADQALARKFIHRSGFGHYPRMLKVLTVPEAVATPQNGYETRLEPEDE